MRTRSFQRPLTTTAWARHRPLGVSAAPTPGPILLTPPEILGRAFVGETLTATTGTWVGSPTFARQWLRNGQPIIGATASTYPVADVDVGALLGVLVTATDASGTRLYTVTLTSPARYFMLDFQLPDNSQYVPLVF